MPNNRGSKPPYKSTLRRQFYLQMKIKFFKSPADFRRWLEKHHGSAKELLVGYYKKGSGQPSITWPESVDEALCFGWIDEIRRRVDEQEEADAACRARGV